MQYFIFEVRQNNKNMLMFMYIFKTKGYKNV
jgi:hypothetical protein